MNIKEIEDYINTHRVYPPEYTGKRNSGILQAMTANFKYDDKTDMIIRKEGRINENGDFELVGFYKFPVGKPEEKIEIKDGLEKSTLRFNYVLTKYNEMMIDLDHKAGVIGDGQNENWNLRDMISEIEYLRSLYYTKGHDRNKLKTENPVLFNRQTSRLRHYIRTYKDHINDMEVTIKHNSKYD